MYDLSGEQGSFLDEGWGQEVKAEAWNGAQRGSFAYGTLSTPDGEGAGSMSQRNGTRMQG